MRARSTSPYSGWARRRAVRRSATTTDDEPPGLQRLERRQSVAALEVGQAEALADGEQFEHRQSRRVDAGEVLVDQLVERHRRRQVTDEVPRAAVVDEHAPFRRPADQLGEHLQVAARQPGELVEGGRRAPGGPARGAAGRRARRVPAG